MKIANVIATIGALATVVGMAAHGQAGGFTGPDNRRIVTAVEATALGDDENVRLIGYIVESIGHETYTFQDETGTIVVEIDSDDWNGLEVAPSVRVEIAGEIDHDRDRIEIDVDTIRLAD